MSYDEHLISMAGGDGERDALDLDAIQARADRVADWRRAFHAPQNSVDYSQRDVPTLLALVREQAAKLGRVEALAELLEKYTVNVRSNNPGLVPEWEGRAKGYEVAAERLRAALTATEPTP